MDARQQKHTRFSAHVSKKSEVKVFYLEQDETWEAPARVVEREEARRLKHSGLGKFINNGQDFRLYESQPRPRIADRAEYRAGGCESSAAICFEEMEANVGIIPDTADPLTVAMAQEKVRSYPHVFDELAALARGSWHEPGRIQISVKGA